MSIVGAFVLQIFAGQGIRVEMLIGLLGGLLTTPSNMTSSLGIHCSTFRCVQYDAADPIIEHMMLNGEIIRIDGGMRLKRAGRSVM